jgi:hypothetical protein
MFPQEEEERGKEEKRLLKCVLHSGFRFHLIKFYCSVLLPSLCHEIVNHSCWSLRTDAVLMFYPNTSEMSFPYEGREDI